MNCKDLYVKFDSVDGVSSSKLYDMVDNNGSYVFHNVPGSILLTGGTYSYDDSVINITLSDSGLAGSYNVCSSGQIILPTFVTASSFNVDGRTQSGSGGGSITLNIPNTAVSNDLLVTLYFSNQPITFALGNTNSNAGQTWINLPGTSSNGVYVVGAFCNYTGTYSGTIRTASGNQPMNGVIMTFRGGSYYNQQWILSNYLLGTASSTITTIPGGTLSHSSMVTIGITTTDNFLSYTSSSTGTWSHTGLSNQYRTSYSIGGQSTGAINYYLSQNTGTFNSLTYQTNSPSYNVWGLYQIYSY